MSKSLRVSGCLVLRGRSEGGHSFRGKLVTENLAARGVSPLAGHMLQPTGRPIQRAAPVNQYVDNAQSPRRQEGCKTLLLDFGWMPFNVLTRRAQTGGASAELRKTRKTPSRKT